MVALDFISLLLTKDAPIQASLSLSPDLLGMVGAKTLGADKLAGSRMTDAQKLDNKKIAKGWKVQNLNKTVDSILASATRLEKEIEHETKYWEQILAVSDKGWEICKLPNQKHILGVRFGFSEGKLYQHIINLWKLTIIASAAFKSRSLAALNRSPDGTIAMDQGLADATPKSLRVRVEVNGSHTGTSTIPSVLPEDASLEALILQARNTIFSEELWQEMNRESRQLQAIQSADHTLRYALSPSKTIVLDLVPIESTPIAAPGPDDTTAEAFFLALGLLLSYAHRQSHRRHTQLPPDISAQTRPNPPLPLLRPLLTRLAHQETLSQLSTLLSPLHRVLLSASLIPAPIYTLLPTVFLSNPHLTPAEQTIAALTERLEVTATLILNPETNIHIIARTTSAPAILTQYMIRISPSTSPLLTLCPPPPTLPSLSAVREYLYQAISSHLASLYASPTSNPPSSPDSGDKAIWQPTAHPTTLQTLLSHPTSPSTRKGKTLTFSLSSLPSPSSASESHDLTVLRARWTHNTGDGSGLSDVGLCGKWSARGRSSSLWDEERGVGVALLKAGREKSGERRMGKGKGVDEKGKKVEAEGSYVWVARAEDKEGSVWDEGEGDIIRSLGDVVEEAGRAVG